ncbi:MAG: RuvX/YqgF family protein, partial [Ruminococcus sp.]|nr:RuvX/YqgF family protein [Ruminococcus sp.]
MIIMSVDFGDSRTGIAVCGRAEMIASPGCVIAEKDFDECIKKTAVLAKEQRAE